MPTNIKASPDLMKFFEKLLKVKEFAKEKQDDHPTIRKIADSLEQIIKEKV